MSWDDKAATWNEDPAVRAYSRGAFRSLVEILQQRGVELSGARVFDFGCGTGLLTEQMVPEVGSVVALDISAAMIEVLRSKSLGDVAAVSASLEDVVGSMLAPLGEFDLITCSSVCAFVDDYPATVARLATLLAPGGIFIQWDWELDPEAEEPWGLTRGEIAGALKAAGLRDVVVDVGFEEPFEAMVMSPLRGVGQR